MTPRLSGDQLLLNISDKSSEMEQVLRLAVTPLQAARTAAGRAQSMNNLKQLGLAMHNYHDTHGRFRRRPFAARTARRCSRGASPSCRFSMPEALYKQFHLDEPWDSEHNKKLIEKMPAVVCFAALGDERRAKGMTSYLVPLTRQPAARRADRPKTASKTGQRGKDEMVFDTAAGHEVSADHRWHQQHDHGPGSQSQVRRHLDQARRSGHRPERPLQGPSRPAERRLHTACLATAARGSSRPRSIPRRCCTCCR